MRSNHSQFFVRSTFQSLDDESIGIAQYMMFDRGMSVRHVADYFDVSVATMYRVKKAVPREAVLVAEELAVKWTRKKAAKSR